MSAGEWAIAIFSVFVVAGLAYVFLHRGSRGGTRATAAKQGMQLPISGIPAEGIGVGDAVKRVTDAFRIKPCNGCERRRAFLNQWVIKGRTRISGGTRTTR